MTIKKLIRLLALVNITGIAAVVLLFVLYQNSQTEITESHENKYLSYLLADEMRQSSDDLTRLGRTYVVTGDISYENQYMDILAIRNGDKPRPQEYHRIYWDFVAAGNSQPRPNDRKASLQELMKSAGFTDEEFGLLSEAQANSDGLVNLEVEAMNAVKGKFKDSSGGYTVTKDPDFALARELVHSKDYHKYKSQIVAPIDKFYVKLDARVNGRITTATATAEFYGALLFVAIAVVALAAIVSAFMLQRKVLDPLGLLESSMIDLSEEKLDTRMLSTEQGGEMGAMAGAMHSFKDTLVSRKDMRLKRDEDTKKAEERRVQLQSLTTSFEESVGSLMEQTTSNIRSLNSLSENLSSNSVQTAENSNQVADITAQAQSDVQIVSAASTELSSSIDEISHQVVTSNRTLETAVVKANETNERIQNLSEAANKVGEVVQLISDIADQTNLLALNATIESARAGEAGKGFAVVATEVKSLAGQTGNATEEITNHINNIQRETKNAVDSIREIGDVIQTIHELSTSIASAVEEQTAATSEIARNVENVAGRTEDIGGRIKGVSDLAAANGNAAGQVDEAVTSVREGTRELRENIQKFLVDVNKA